MKSSCAKKDIKETRLLIIDFSFIGKNDLIISAQLYSSLQWLSRFWFVWVWCEPVKKAIHSFPGVSHSPTFQGDNNQISVQKF